MRRLGPAAVWFSLVFGAGRFAHECAAGPAFPFPVRTTRLENGLTVTTVGFESPGVVTYGTVVRYQTEEGEGSTLGRLAILAAEEGTPRIGRAEFQHRLERRSAERRVIAERGWTYSATTVPSRALAAIVELEADRVRNLPRDEAAYRRAAAALRAEAARPGSSTVALRSALERSVRGAPPEGGAEGVDAAGEVVVGGVAEFRRFVDRWYRPENCAIVAAGDVDHEALVSVVRKSYGDWTRGPGPGPSQAADRPSTRTAATASTPPPRSTVLSWPEPVRPRIGFAFEVPGGGPADRGLAALRLLAVAGFGDSSPLYRALVLDERKVVELHAAVASAPRRGLFIVEAVVRDPADLDEVRSRIETALWQATREPVSPWRLGKVKEHVFYSFIASIDRPSAAARAIARAMALYGSVGACEKSYDALAPLVPRDLRTAAAKYLTPERLSVVVLLAGDHHP